jgi:hypothetical protein
VLRIVETKLRKTSTIYIFFRFNDSNQDTTAQAARLLPCIRVGPPSGRPSTVAKVYFCLIVLQEKVQDNTSNCTKVFPSTFIPIYCSKLQVFWDVTLCLGMFTDVSKDRDSLNNFMVNTILRIVRNLSPSHTTLCPRSLESYLMSL